MAPGTTRTDDRKSGQLRKDKVTCTSLDMQLDQWLKAVQPPTVT